MNRKQTDPIIILAWRVPAPVGVFLLSVALSPQAFATCDCECSPCDICVESYEKRNISGNEATNCIEVEAGGMLNIQGGAALTVTGPESSCVDGYVILVADATYEAVLKFTTVNHTIAGSGDIVGQDDDAEIVIDGVTLTSQVDIRGRMHIKDGTSAGTLNNRGRVMADDPSGTLDLELTTIDDTSGSGRWQVTASGAQLRFIAEPQPLDGSFTVSNGALRAGTDVSSDDIDVCTSGDLSHSGGYIIAGVSDSFSFNCASCPCVE